MAQPSSRSTLIDYCKRQLGAPLLEINIADEQTEDLLDDAIQYFQERHFNGVIQTFLKYKVRQVDIDRSRGKGAENQIGIVTTTTSATVAGISTTFSVGIDTTPSSGYGLTISLGSTATRSINAGRYVYDVLVGSGMTVYRIVDGNILVRGGVSSAP